MLNQIKFVTFLLGTLITSAYAGKPTLKEERAVYSVRYWDRAMAPDEKKEWRFFADTREELSRKTDEIISALNIRVEEVRNLLTPAIRSTNEINLPIRRMRHEMKHLKWSNKKGIVYGYYSNDYQNLVLLERFERFPRCSLNEEEERFAKMITDETHIVSGLKEDGKIGNYESKILNWGEYGSYAGFQEKISTLSEEKKEKAYTKLVKLNIYNILAFKMDCEKDWVSFDQPKFSKDDPETKSANLRSPFSKKNNEKNINSYKIKKTRTFHRDSAIEVK
jgi:hypothetical protein